MSFKKEKFEEVFRMKDLKIRLLISVFMVTLLFAVVYFSDSLLPSLCFLLIVMVVTGTALWEFYQLCAKKEMAPEVSIGVGAALCYGAATYLTLLRGAPPFLPLAVTGAFLFILFVKQLFFPEKILLSLASTFFGFFYIAVPLAFFLKINYFPIWGKWCILFVIVVTKASDVGGYFIGKTFGRKALAPKISPGKTREGFWGGMLFSCAASFALIFFVRSPIRSLHGAALYALLLGILISVFGQLGDLSESLLKRDAGVKDSNRLKGFGGLLDMTDSLLFTTPLFYLFLSNGMFA